MKEDNTRTWESVCHDCLHFDKGLCRHEGSRAAPEDPIAAICRWFTPKTRNAATERDPLKNDETQRRNTP